MATRLDNKRIAFLVAPEGVEQVELAEPWKAVEQACGTSPHPGGQPDFLRTNHGAIWVDEQVVTCSRGLTTLVSSCDT